MLIHILLIAFCCNFANIFAINATNNQIKNEENANKFEENSYSENLSSEEESLVINRIFSSFSEIKTKKCIKDLNDTISGYHLKKAWAIASKSF